MPMIWNAEADAQLLVAIIQVYEIKFSGPKVEEIAAIMGPDCTARAIGHRFTKFRALAKTDSTQDASNASGTVKQVKTATVKKRWGGKKIAARAVTPDDGDDEEAKKNDLTPPPSERPKRGSKRDYAALTDEIGDGDDGDEGNNRLDKDVKIEVGEDVGEGLRATSDPDLFFS